ncbi:MAG: hypothetical protein OEU26_30400, partial [Candidatus Tectomicrobia bacterium]|nr:hypothetical protein [Candidatus Tectomicrobia bacterium]
MFDYLQQRAQQLPNQFWRGRLGELVVELKHGDERYYLTLNGDGVHLNRDHADRPPDLTLSASVQAWQA